MRFMVKSWLCLLVVVAAALGSVAAVHAAEPTGTAAACEYMVGGDHHDVVLAVPRTSLGSGLDCTDVRSQVRVGPATQQAGPHSSSTTWSWEFCVYVSTPNGTVYEWCFKISITTSTTVPDGSGVIDVQLLRAEHGSSPAKICWDERLPNGEVATHCIEITIEAGR